MYACSHAHIHFTSRTCKHTYPPAYTWTGGAGFIGSHASLMLLEQGHAVTVLDNLSRGNPGALLAVSRRASPEPSQAPHPLLLGAPPVPPPPPHTHMSQCNSVTACGHVHIVSVPACVNAWGARCKQLAGVAEARRRGWELPRPHVLACPHLTRAGTS